MTYFRRAAELSRHASEQAWRRGLRWVGRCWMLFVADPEFEAGTGVRGAAFRPPKAVADAAGNCDWQALQLLSSRLLPSSSLGRLTLSLLRAAEPMRVRAPPPLLRLRGRPRAPLAEVGRSAA